MRIPWLCRVTICQRVCGHILHWPRNLQDLSNFCCRLLSSHLNRPVNKANTSRIVRGNRNKTCCIFPVATAQSFWTLVSHRSSKMLAKMPFAPADGPM